MVDFPCCTFTWFSLSNVGIQTTRPQPPVIKTIRSIAAGLIPPTDLFRSIPPNISIPGTSFRTTHKPAPPSTRSGS